MDSIWLIFLIPVLIVYIPIGIMTIYPTVDEGMYDLKDLSPLNYIYKVALCFLLWPLVWGGYWFKDIGARGFLLNEDEVTDLIYKDG